MEDFSNDEREQSDNPDNDREGLVVLGVEDLSPNEVELIKNGLVLIAKRRSTDRLANKWEFPGGTVEQGETPEECLKREMKEEFAITVSVSGYLGDSLYDYDHGTIRLLAFRAFWENGDIMLKAHDDFRWVSPDELQAYDFAPADLPFADRLRRGEIV